MLTFQINKTRDLSIYYHISANMTKIVAEVYTVQTALQNT